jgi:hypothetical protein
MIEALWRSLRHPSLYLHSLESFTQLIATRSSTRPKFSQTTSSCPKRRFRSKQLVCLASAPSRAKSSSSIRNDTVRVFRFFPVSFT